MPKALNSPYGSQSQLLDVSIMRLSVKEIVIEVINNMFSAFVIVLYQQHGDSTRGYNEIKEVITMIVRRVQQRIIHEENF